MMKRFEQELIPAPTAYEVGAAFQQLGLSRALGYRLIASGELKTYTVGRRRFVPALAMAEFIESKLAAASAIAPQASMRFRLLGRASRAKRATTPDAACGTAEPEHAVATSVAVPARGSR